ncbi:MAG TPA: hypothetical protein VF635_16750, partial [Propionibacteriaceae bacterium]
VNSGDLAEDRVRHAADRVPGLANELATLRTAIPIPPDFAPGESDLIAEGKLIRSFDLSEVASSWGHPHSYTVVRLEAIPNMATGQTPWGPFAALAADQSSPANLTFAAQPQIVVTPDRSAAATPPGGQRVVVVGRDLHRHAFARDVIDRLRDEHREVLVVDMGWPADDRRYADVATFGSSRLMGQALLNYLHHQ